MAKTKIAAVSCLVGLLLCTSSAEAAVNFTDTAVPVSGGKPLDVAVGDLDGANGPDLVASINQSGTTSLAVRLNNGDGTFAAEHLYPLGCVAGQVELTDLGGTSGDNTPDGALDAVVFCLGGGYGGYIGRIAGDGTGGFVGPGTFPGALVAGTADGLETEGGFQRMTIALVRPAGSPSTPFWTYYYNAGTLVNPAYLSALCWTNDWSTLTCSGAAYNPPQPNIYPPLTTGTVADARLFGTGVPENRGTPDVRRTDRLVAWGDFPGASPPPGTTITGTERSFGPSPGIQSPPWQSIAIGDLAGDGPDILTSEGVCGCLASSTDPAAGKVSVLPGDGGGVQPAVTPISFDSAPGVLSIAVGDIDLDGKQDVIGTSHTSSGNSVFVHLGDGAGGLASPVTVPVGGEGSAYSRAPIQLADFDRNGSPDAVVITDAIQVLSNKSTQVPPIDPNDPVNPLAGLSGLKSSVKADKKGAVLLGTATNPPTASVNITITIPKPKPKPKGSADPLAAKTTVIGKAKVTIPAGETKPLKIPLKSKARKQLKHGKLKAKVTLVATATDGTEETKTQALKIKPAKKQSLN